MRLYTMGVKTSKLIIFLFTIFKLSHSNVMLGRLPVTIDSNSFTSTHVKV